MTTRSGTAYKQLLSMEELNDERRYQEERVNETEEGRNQGGRDGSSPMVEMLQILVDDRQRWEEERRRREAEYEEEKRRRENEDARREELTLRQMAVLQSLVEGVHLQGEAASRRAQVQDDSKEVKVPKLTEQDDIVSYITMFERLMTAFEIKYEKWAFKLASHLSGKAQQAYAALSVDDAGDFEKLKNAILRRYDITEESYRQRFRSTKRMGDESYRETVARLNDLAMKWLKTKETRAKVVDQIVLEQFLMSLTDEVRVFVRERSPGTSEEAAKLADDYTFKLGKIICMFMVLGAIVPKRGEMTSQEDNVIAVAK